MRYDRVFLNCISYELGPEVVTSSTLEERLESLYKKYRLPKGQLAALTGIYERRWWPPGYKSSTGAIVAAKKAIAETGLDPADIGAVIYTGVCRDQHEPATACMVASQLGVNGYTANFDISNACLGVLSGLLDVANRIQLGQIKAGIVVSCESSRDIVDVTIERMLEQPTMQNFAQSLATLTGGSGAVAVVLSNGELNLDTDNNHQLLGASQLAAPEHHDLCEWGMQPTLEDNRLYREFMRTDAVKLLKEGVALAAKTWEHFLGERKWAAEQVDKVICHQVGSSNRKQVLEALDIPDAKEFPAYRHLGNMGTVSLPVAAAIASEHGFLNTGDNVSFLGIGSGLNCIMLGLKW